MRSKVRESNKIMGKATNGGPEFDPGETQLAFSKAVRHSIIK